MAKRIKRTSRKAGARKRTAAKKTGKSAARKVAKKAARTTRASEKKAVRKKAAKKSVQASTKKTAARSKGTKAAGDPMKGLVAARRLKTGRGADPRTIGEDLVLLCNTGRSDEVTAKWLHPRVESIEADGQVWKGTRGVEAKSAWWYANHEVHGFSAEGPFVGASGFAVRFRLAVTPKGGSRMEMVEIGVYTVRDGKIVREEFMYG